MRERLQDFLERWREEGWSYRILVLLVLLVVANLGTMLWWDHEPDPFDVVEAARRHAGVTEGPLVPGYVTTVALREVAATLLEKRGGYLTNDRLSPAVFMDNIPNWEFGVVVQVRDLAQVLRNDFSRSQTQSTEDPDLAIADPQFHFDTDSWLFPPTESEYRKGIRALDRYLARLADPAQQQAQFYARADNLRTWLGFVEKRLGSLSQRLSASVGQVRINIDLEGEPEGEQSTPAPQEMVIKTPWLEIDDVFYEARGACWALIHFLRAVEVDFAKVLEKKNARVSLKQIIRELESTQEPVWSPVILNGTGFGLVANHSLVMASYISRANAALIDLRDLLQQG
ncbi:MAG: DUF2333 family protein [Gammaproteobacteria bacterium]|nr:MAG: DUF2333 family protein [Gammaproteobacteria bacterium]